MRFGSCAPISSEVFLQSDATLRSNDTCIALSSGLIMPMAHQASRGLSNGHAPATLDRALCDLRQGTHLRSDVACHCR